LKDGSLRSAWPWRNFSGRKGNLWENREKKIHSARGGGALATLGKKRGKRGQAPCAMKVHDAFSGTFEKKGKGLPEKGE